MATQNVNDLISFPCQITWEITQQQKKRFTKVFQQDFLRILNLELSDIANDKFSISMFSQIFHYIFIKYKVFITSQLHPSAGLLQSDEFSS